MTDICDWVDTSEFYDKVIERVKDIGLGTTELEYWCDQYTDEQVVKHQIIRCVPMNLIKYEAPWSKERLESARKWASRFNLNSIAYKRDGFDEEVKAKGVVKFYRTTRLDDKSDITRYTIEDGIHRIALAKELGMGCILGVASESYLYTKEG